MKAILVQIDFSDGSLAALESADLSARRLDCKLTLLDVVPRPGSSARLWRLVARALRWPYRRASDGKAARGSGTMADHSVLDPGSFRPVPRTGVIYVMGEATRLGFHYGHPDWSNLGQGAPETGPLPGAPDRVTTVSLDDASHEYAPVGGLPALREAVAALYNARYRRGMASQYTAENVAISSGGRSGLTRIAAALGNVHLGHLLPDYTAYAELLDNFRAFVPIPIVVDREAGFRLSPRLLEREIAGRGIGAMLFSNPCNPTGQRLGGHELGELLGVARRTRCTVILDEFYSHYLYDHPIDNPPAESAAAWVEDVDRDPVLVVDGLTKNWRYPGWRLSWTLGPKDVIARITSAGSFLDGGPSHPLQSAAIPLLDPAHADAEARAIQSMFKDKRKVMLDACRSIGLVVDPAPRGAFYAFASLERLPPQLRDGHAFFRAALEHQVIVVPGRFFDVDPGGRRAHLPSRLEGFVRLSFGPSMTELTRGLDRLATMVRAAG